MNEIIYDSAKLTLYFSYLFWEFFKQTTIADCHSISYKELIEEINKIPDWSEAKKRHAIIFYGKRAGILEEIA